MLYLRETNSPRSAHESSEVFELAGEFAGERAAGLVAAALAGDCIANGG